MTMHKGFRYLFSCVIARTHMAPPNKDPNWCWVFSSMVSDDDGKTYVVMRDERDKRTLKWCSLDLLCEHITSIGGNPVIWYTYKKPNRVL